MKKLKTGSAAITALLAWLSYLGAHIAGAIVLFKSVKLWLFLVILLVPGIGDIAGIICLIKVGSWWPFILYGASIVFWIVSGLLARAADEKPEPGRKGEASIKDDGNEEDSRQVYEPVRLPEMENNPPEAVSKKEPTPLSDFLFALKVTLLAFVLIALSYFSYISLR